MTFAEKQQRIGELMHQWGDAERLCNELCHKLDWANGDDIRRIKRLLDRARARTARRYDRYHNLVNGS